MVETVTRSRTLLNFETFVQEGIVSSGKEKFETEHKRPPSGTAL